MKIKTRCRVLFVAMVSVALGASQASGAELPLVRVGYGGIAGYQLPLWVNKEAGLAKKYGIDLEPLLIGGGSLMVTRSFLDMSLVDELEREGFVQRLYGN